MSEKFIDEQVNPWPSGNKDKSPWPPFKLFDDKEIVHTHRALTMRTEPRCYVQTYHPLIEFTTPDQITAPDDFFVDGGIRREPSFESEMPGITSICRGSTYAPTLIVGDRIIYLTILGKHFEDPESIRRIVSALEITHTFQTHESASQYYREQNVTIPTNCIVDDTTYRLPGNANTGGEVETDNFYKGRVEANTVFHVCKILSQNLNTPPTLSQSQLDLIMGGHNLGLNKTEISEAQFSELQSIIEQTTVV